MSEYTHILVPVDLRQHSHIVLQRAAFTASLHKAQLTVLHVVEYLPLRGSTRRFVCGSGHKDAESDCPYRRHAG